MYQERLPREGNAELFLNEWVGDWQRLGGRAR